MNQTPDTTTAGNGDSLDPRQAAALLGRTTRQAHRQLEPYPPWMSLIRAVMVLLGCGAIWLSVRGQHPYKGPTAAVAIPAVLGFVLVNFVATVAVAKRATIGVTGRSRLRPAETAVMAVAWIGVFVVMAILAGTGVSRSVVYGLFPTTAPLIVGGLAWAGIMAARANRRGVTTGLAVAAVGALAILAGPVWVWVVAGLGIALVLLGGATATAVHQHRAVRP